MKEHCANTYRQDLVIGGKKESWFSSNKPNFLKHLMVLTQIMITPQLVHCVKFSEIGCFQFFSELHNFALKCLRVSISFGCLSGSPIEECNSENSQGVVLTTQFCKYLSLTDQSSDLTPKIFQAICLPQVYREALRPNSWFSFSPTLSTCELALHMNNANLVKLLLW